MLSDVVGYDNMAGLVVLAPFVAAAGVVAATLLVAGGVCYSAGALASRYRR